ncbi:MAG: hypothetical protein M3367_09950 [Acidobacteriota bacterium]|nr:hypothetical protein [Acidobacteriota bacterium]
MKQPNFLMIFIFPAITLFVDNAAHFQRIIGLMELGQKFSTLKISTLITEAIPITGKKAKVFTLAFFIVFVIAGTIFP